MSSEMFCNIEAGEQRAFGRHGLTKRAWVLLDDGTKVLCVIRNFSPKGALLEFASSMPEECDFDLFLDLLTTVRCSVSHRQQRSLGVLFGTVQPPAIKASTREEAGSRTLIRFEENASKE